MVTIFTFHHTTGENREWATSRAIIGLATFDILIFKNASEAFGSNWKFFKFLLSLNSMLNSQKRLGYKKTTPNIEVCPESLGAMLEY